MLNKRTFIFAFFTFIILAFCFLVRIQPLYTENTSVTYLESGWDFNLTHRCVKSPHPDKENYYQDTADCPIVDKNWTIAVESEKDALLASCPGPVNQSFPINVGGSPLTLKWLSHQSELGDNWSVNLKTDLSTNTHPCGSGYFTWFVFMNHLGHGGGPLPRPNEVVFSATVNFNDFVPDGHTRAIAGWEGWWDGKARAVELDFQGTGWGDNYPDDPAVVNYIDNDRTEFVTVDGSAYGIYIQKFTDTEIKIEWITILEDLILRGFLKAPSGGWENTSTYNIFLGHETKNNQPDNSVVADLWFTNFRVEEKSVNHAPILSPINNKEIQENELLAFTISATDPDVNTLTYSASNLPPGANFNSTNRTFSWTPATGQAGTYSNVHFEVSDGSLADSEDVTITVIEKEIPPPPEVTLLKARDDPKVYEIKDNKKHWIPNPEVFNTSGFKWTDIQEVEQSELNQYPRVKLLQAQGGYKVYYLAELGLMRHIPSPEIFISYGNKWEDIFTVSQTELATYPENNLIHLEGDYKIYKLENGTKHWIKTAEAFNRLSFDWSKIALVNILEFNYYSIGDIIE